MHIGFLSFALLGLPLLRSVLINVSFYFYNLSDYRSQMRNFSIIFSILYWGLLVMAHGFFISVMRKCFARKPEVVVAGPG